MSHLLGPPLRHCRPRRAAPLPMRVLPATLRSDSRSAFPTGRAFRRRRTYAPDRGRRSVPRSGRKIKEAAREPGEEGTAAGKTNTPRAPRTSIMKEYLNGTHYRMTGLNGPLIFDGDGVNNLWIHSSGDGFNAISLHTVSRPVVPRLPVPPLSLVFCSATGSPETRGYTDRK